MRFHSDEDKDYKRFKNMFMYFFLKSSEGADLLFRQRKAHVPQRVITDHSQRNHLIAGAHNICGHRSCNQTFKYLWDRYWWPNMYDDIAWFIRSCNSCQMHSRMHPIIPLNITFFPSMFCSFICDTIIMLNGHRGFKHLLHASEASIKWFEARASRWNMSSSWATFIYKDIIACFGCIPILICDGSSKFQGAVKEILHRYNVQWILSSPYYPQGNGVTEWDGQTLANAILHSCGDRKSQWPLFLHSALFTLCTSTSHTTSYTPFFLLYGQEALLPFDLMDCSWYTLDWHTIRNTEDLITLYTQQIAQREEHLRKATKETVHTRQSAIDNYMKKNVKHISSGIFEPGTWVLVHEMWLDCQLGNKGSLR